MTLARMQNRQMRGCGNRGHDEKEKIDLHRF
jgi:hypothetical protein